VTKLKMLELGQLQLQWFTFIHGDSNDTGKREKEREWRAKGHKRVDDEWNSSAYGRVV
jgi:hypothetical protein